MIDCLYDRFKDWCKNGSIYIISDTHFDDEDCIKMSPNWISAEEQIAILKKLVHKNDTLIHLGDVGNIEYMKQIRGHKVLLMGNHDTGVTKFKEVFDEVYEGPLMISEKILLSHEPIPNLDWCLNIHGHDHSGRFCRDKYHLNLAANICGYKPISLGEYVKTCGLSKIKSLHRDIIDNATERKKKRNKNHIQK